MGRQTLSVSGLFIALLGFVLTRFTVTLAAMEMSVQFLFAGIVPLVLGLSLSAFGVVLTVGAYSKTFVRTTAVWCFLGTGAMFLLIVLTLLGSRQGMLTSIEAWRSRTILSNFLIGGAVGGTLTGLYAAQNRHNRTVLRQQANRLILLNRLLRDQVINAATAIKGHNEVLETTHDQRSVDVIGRQADKVVEIVENVKYLSGTANGPDLSLSGVDVHWCVERAIEDVRSEFPDAEYVYESPTGSPNVRANEQLREAIAHLVRNAVEHNDKAKPRVEVAVETMRHTVTVRVSDDGPGLPSDQQSLLEYGDIAEFDDPSTGFGLNIVRLLVESFDGGIDTTVTGAGSTVSLELPRASGGTTHTTRSLTAPGVSRSHLALGVGAGLVAGVTMGITTQFLAGFVPVIGALYGLESPVIGWITHEFHSIVFALVYAGILSVAPLPYTDGAAKRVGIAVGFSVFLWIVAAGLVMPAWLLLVGVDATLPNLTVTTLFGHAVWGVTLGTLYHLGDGWLDRTDAFDGGLFG